MSNIKRDPLTGDPVLDHDYDGIEEMDNPLPSWWVGLFYGCIVFAIGYFIYYNVMDDGDPIRKVYNQEWQANRDTVAAIEAKQTVDLSDESLLKQAGDPAVSGAGLKVFSERCASCHGSKAEGLIGPNLTDAHWLNGNGTPMAILKVLKEGVPEKGMPAWGPILNQQEMAQLVAYIVSVKGSQPPNAKAAQGKEFK